MMILCISFNRLVLFFLSVGFLVLSFEVFLLHYQGLNEKKVMWTPIIFGLIGGILGIFSSVLFNRLTYYLSCLIMFMAIIVGTMGLYFHNQWRFPLFINFVLKGIPFPLESLTTVPPLLAPSAFIAMGSLGILLAIFMPWGKKD